MHPTPRRPKRGRRRRESKPTEAERPGRGRRREDRGLRQARSRTLDEEAQGEDLEELRRQYLLRRFWHTASRFWTDPQVPLAWLLSGLLLVIILLNLAASYAMNQWNRSIFDALEKKDGSTVLTLSMVYFVILAVSVGFSVAQVYARMTLQRRWRKWLTDILVDRWLKSGRYYQLNLVSGDHKIRNTALPTTCASRPNSPVDFVSGVTSAFLSAATFIVVLWTIGGALSFSIGATQIIHPRLSGDRGGALRGDRERRDDDDRPPVRGRLRRQEPIRSRVALRADAPARERREHCAHPRRRGGARGRRPGARQGPAVMALDLPAVHEDDHGIEHLGLHRAGAADHPVCAEIPRRLDDAWAR